MIKNNKNVKVFICKCYIELIKEINSTYSFLRFRRITTTMMMISVIKMADGIRIIMVSINKQKYMSTLRTTVAYKSCITLDANYDVIK